jgi:hypothetical protein
MNDLIRCGELCNRLGIKSQTVYNKIYRNELKLNIHYFKPSRRLLLFDWEAIQDWIRGGVDNVGHKERNNSEQEKQKTSEIRI